MKLLITFSVLTLIVCSCLFSSRVAAAPNFSSASSYLEVSSNGRYFVHHDTKEPVIFLADTVWEHARRLTVEEIDFYFSRRSEQGFTGVLMPVLGPLGAGLGQTYAVDGTPVFNGNNPSTPNDAYFAIFDQMIKSARDNGIIVGILPAFGWKQESFNETSAYNYGKYLGNRYKDEPHILWVLGGDMKPGNSAGMWAKMAQGIKDGSTSHPAVISYHPFGGQRSSTYFPGASWMSFYLSQPGHGNNIASYNWVLDDYKLNPAKPTLLGEVAYENIRFIGGVTTPLPADQARRHIYYGLLAGAAGHTYGETNIMQAFGGAGKEFNYGHPSPGGFGGDTNWKIAMEAEGANSMKPVYDLFATRAWEKLVPNEISAFLTSGQGGGADRKAAALASDGSFAVVYYTRGGDVTVNMAKFSKPVTVTWINPITGAKQTDGTVSNTGTHTFSSKNGGPDFVLLLDTGSSSVTPTTAPVTPTITTVPTTAPTTAPTVQPSATGQPITPTSTSCKTGDIDCSGKVNAVDLSILLSKFGGADESADIDKSGKVNAVDLSLLLQNFGK